MPEKILNWKETPKKWSILECLEHLNRYSIYYNAEIEKSILRAFKSDNSGVEAKSTWLGNRFIKMMHPDNTAKQKTFARMNPASSALNQSTLDKFLQHQNELLRLLQKASDVNLNKTSIPVEFIKLLKMNLGDGLQFVIVHELRHINQAKRVKAAADALALPILNA